MITAPLPLAATLAAITALAFWLDRHVPVLSRVGASLLVLILGALLSNVGLVTAHSPVYGAVTGPVTSLAIVWLLLAVHVTDLRHAGGRMLAAFGLAVLGTLAGATAATALLAVRFGDESWRLAGAFVGTYTGGSLNFVAVGRGLQLPDTLFAGANAADAVTTAIWLAACLLLPIWLRRFYPFPIPGEDQSAAAATADRSESHPFFAPAGISVLSLAVMFAVGLALLIAADAAATAVPQIPSVLWLTTFALIVGHLPPFARTEGAMQLGNFALHLFFAVIGIYSRIADILTVGVAVFVFTSITVGIHGLVVFGFGRLAKLDVGTLSVASQAAVGGPSSALAVAVSRDWPLLVLPGIIVGLLGYAVGNYLGFGVAYILRGLGL